jgi:Na+-transporting methylmalonyl-CoA/oxaloacetate decarboxylase gamma subunit
LVSFCDIATTERRRLRFKGAAIRTLETPEYEADAFKGAATKAANDEAAIVTAAIATEFSTQNGRQN